ncbi:MAG: hypothetical protein R8J84_05625 [Mariprofundales bacterium]
MRKVLNTGLLIALLLLAGCASHQPFNRATTTTIGPFPNPHGRILLLGNHRAQLMFSCQSPSRQQGSCHFTHGASGRVIDIRWHHASIAMRDTSNPLWRKVSEQQLQRLGLTLAPSSLIAILTGTIPDWLQPLRNGVWQGKHQSQRIRLQWLPEKRQMDAINLSRGNRIRIFLDPDQP